MAPAASTEVPAAGAAGAGGSGAEDPDPRGRGGDPVGLDPAPLRWGQHFLMCPPTHFDVTYEINPYMDRRRPPDHDRAEAQFAGLVDALRQAGAAVSLLDPVPGLPDLVFTANAGLVDVGGGRRWFVPGRFRHCQRQGETPVDVAWFADHGWSVVPVPGGQPFEGAGDALPFGAGGDRPVLVAGYRTRSSVAAHLALSSLLGVPVRSVELVDERFYHVDLVFCPLDDRRALVAPQGLDRYGRAVVADVVPEPIWLEDDEAAAFCANSVVVGTTIVMPWCSHRLERRLGRMGLQVVVTPVDEFQKAGGGCRCLTLALDVPIGSPAAVMVPAAG
jgi:N-dimethylarginine dimethylaminohydrolase